MTKELLFPMVRFLFGFPLGLLYTLITVFGIYLSRKKIVRYLSILLLIVYCHSVLFFMTVGPGGLQRFILSIVPLYSFFACFFILKICQIEDINYNTA